MRHYFWKVTALSTLILIVILVVTYSVFVRPRNDANSSTLDIEIISSLINQSRQQAGLELLVANPVLNQAAQAKADDMAKNAYFAHYSPGGKRGISFIKDFGYEYTTAGENLAVYFDSAEDLVGSWLNSPTHRQNILSVNFQETGIGLANGTYQGYETSFVVQMFASPAKPAPKETPSSKPVTTPSSSSQISSIQSSSSQPITSTSANPEPQNSSTSSSLSSSEIPVISQNPAGDAEIIKDALSNIFKVTPEKKIEVEL